MFLQKWLSFYFHLPIFIRLLLSVLLLMFLFGLLIHMLEPVHFPTIFDGIWWAFVTGSTVGYGDYVPLSLTGKIVGIMLILAGGGLVTFYMATISIGTVKHEQDLSEGKVTFKGTNHIIIVGWNERTKALVNTLQNVNPTKDIVVIDKTLQNILYRKNNFHFIKGEASMDSVLQKANIAHAEKIVITSDPNMNESSVDRQTIITTLAARGMNPSLLIISEIAVESQRENIARAGADVIIQSNELMSSLLFQTVRHPEIPVANIINQTLTHFDFFMDKIPENAIGKSFEEYAQVLLSQQIWLIGIQRNGENLFGPNPGTTIEKEDYLIYLQLTT
ncbi:voltage-gated potassium channel [Gracilibacillus halotolerans]|uniref:Voltage-gated potassium channel n=1 Tax=Gracilibacillus halotolerans TaxID=74386 RepID=A0A841RID3_9BACI|nr:potassium channel family protein [Gracilibacillus halotolerans]MBB6511236.1 voltage-gated potassium channel [Gracilibacillus halotolerans]